MHRRITNYYWIIFNISFFVSKFQFVNTRINATTYSIDSIIFFFYLECRSKFYYVFFFLLEYYTNHSTREKNYDTIRLNNGNEKLFIDYYYLKLI